MSQCMKTCEIRSLLIPALPATPAEAIRSIQTIWYSQATRRSAVSTVQSVAGLGL